MTLSCEHGHGMVEDIAATLDTLVKPACSIPVLLDGDRECLATTVVHSVDECYLEFLGVLREVICTGHARGTGSNDENLLGLGHVGVVSLTFDPMQRPHTNPSNVHLAFRRKTKQKTKRNSQKQQCPITNEGDIYLRRGDCGRAWS